MKEGWKMEGIMAIVGVIFGLSCWVYSLVISEDMSKARRITIQIVLMLLGAGAIALGAGILIRLIR